MHKPSVEGIRTWGTAGVLTAVAGVTGTATMIPPGFSPEHHVAAEPNAAQHNFNPGLGIIATNLVDVLSSLPDMHTTLMPGQETTTVRTTGGGVLKIVIKYGEGSPQRPADVSSIQIRQGAELADGTPFEVGHVRVTRNLAGEWTGACVDRNDFGLESSITASTNGWVSVNGAPALEVPVALGQELVSNVAADIDGIAQGMFGGDGQGSMEPAPSPGVGSGC